MDRVHLIISGRVQGVSYRYNAYNKARTLGLTGWVRNLANGDVETTAEGRREALEEFIAWCRRGPMLARVTSVKTEWLKATGEWSEFQVTY